VIGRGPESAAREPNPGAPGTELELRPDVERHPGRRGRSAGLTLAKPRRSAEPQRGHIRSLSALRPEAGVVGGKDSLNTSDPARSRPLVLRESLPPTPRKARSDSSVFADFAGFARDRHRRRHWL
jgi:hypothetical protein